MRSSVPQHDGRSIDPHSRCCGLEGVRPSPGRVETPSIKDAGGAVAMATCACACWIASTKCVCVYICVCVVMAGGICSSDLDFRHPGSFRIRASAQGSQNIVDERKMRGGEF